MIKSIEIKNFQSHSHTKLDLCPGVNIITGQSDSGKTAILRALYWTLYNKPTGCSFIRHGTKKASVKIEFDDCTIERIRSNSKNLYIVDEQELKALGSKCPEEVLSKHKVPNFCFQSQFDQSFLLQDSSGEVARKLNEIVGLDIIDIVVKKTNSMLTEAKHDITRIQNELDHLKKEIDSYSYLDEVENTITNLDDLFDTYDKTENSIENLKNLIEDIIITVKDYSNFERLVTKTSGCIEDLGKLIDEHGKISKDYNLLKQVILDLESIEHKLQSLVNTEDAHNLVEELDLLIDKKKGLLYEISELDDTLTKVRRIEGRFKYLSEVVSYENEITDCLDLVSRLSNVIKRYKELSKLYNNLLEIKEKFNDNKKELSAYTDQYIEILKETGICPLCQNKLDSGCLDNILKELSI